jgi:hypothetical protein
MRAITRLKVTEGTVVESSSELDASLSAERHAQRPEGEADRPLQPAVIRQ